MSIDRLLDRWRSDSEVYPNIVAWNTIPPRTASLADFPSSLNPALADALRRKRILSLYSHQAEAFAALENRQNVVIVTGTASGKTLCYNLPVLNAILGDVQTRALYLFPTKALAHDQRDNVGEMINDLAFPGSLENPIAAAYDGDTPSDQRKLIRSQARIAISNPDMLHTGILPHHTLWADYFKRLRYIVLDEMHHYRGVFGSHVANVIRRLKRVCRFYGAKPQFILTSATIANPAQLAEGLIEEKIYLIENDGSARGEKHFLIYNPPVINQEIGFRRSALAESISLARQLYERNIQGILFGRTRRTVELLVKYLRENIAADENAIRGYRSGYLPRQRRQIEQGLRDGSVRLAAATNALELGIDIGGMGAAILVGYPGTISATWQQAGRAGRKNAASLAVLIASPNPLDQFLARHPEYFFGRSPEQALINPDNPLILLQHIRCAAFELPFQSGDSFGLVASELLQEYLDFLTEENTLHKTAARYFWMADQYPASQVSLRSASPDAVRLQVDLGDGVQTIGEVDSASAPWMVHPNAVYMHEGQAYEVKDLDLENGVARLEISDGDYYTEPRQETTIELESLYQQEPVPGAQKAYGEIIVTTQVIGFRRMKWYTNEPLAAGELTLPPGVLHTTGYWLALEESVIETLRAQGLWSSDPNNYGPGWANLRAAVRQRDGYRCQVCGIPENGKSHHVHHIKPFRTFLSIEEANRLENLVTLCPNCHRRAETALRIRSGLAGLAYVLGNLAPLFLMCDAGDIGVHSDPQSPLSEGKPTVVIYDQAPGGIGFSQRLYEIHNEMIGRSLEQVSACDCGEGCPSCVGPAGENSSGGKAETLAILQALVR
jgi:DEAD/DEAH box helicase domain-containing protein